MIFDEIEGKDWRYERKFRVEGLPNKSISHIVKMNPFHFSEVFSPRNVNNIYFDTIDKVSYFDNVDGLSDRFKVRIRWYGELFGPIEKPVLEIKIKRNLLGSKYSLKLKPFSLIQGFSMSDILEVLEKSEVSELIKRHMASLEPTLVNRYSRCYFLSLNKKFRITLDNNLEYFPVCASGNSFLHNLSEKLVTILELKYAERDNNYASEITQHFPFRMTKNSKYITGIDLTGF